MEILKSPVECRTKVFSLKAERVKIGFVPTMGALHQGHLQLLDQAKKKSDFVVTSIFVNPAQFNNRDDYKRYPKHLETDLQKLRNAGCDLAFVPDEDDMYQGGAGITMGFPSLEKTMEGLFRPGHFRGVGLIVSKLFNVVPAHAAFFGQKDWQQVLIIRQLVQDLLFDIDIVAVPTVREADGLAMSSRNLLLSADQRERAIVFYRSLQLARRALLGGATVEETKELVAGEVGKTNGVSLEYFEVANRETLEAVTGVERDIPVSLFIAGYVGEIRLIDNIFLQEEITLKNAY